MRIFFMEHPRSLGDAYCNDIANTPLSSCLMIPSLRGLLEREHEVAFADGFLGKETYEKIKEKILAFRPQLIGVHMVYQWDDHQALRRFLEELSQECDALIVACGFYPSFAYDDLLASIQGLDGVVVGEPESAFLGLAQGLPPTEVPSLAYRGADSQVVKNPAKVVKDLDTLPFPHYSESLLGIGEVNIEGSRGCYNHCTFCYINDYYGEGCRWRGHSVDYICREIEEIIEKTGNRRFYFVDPNFFGPGVKGQCRALEMAAKLKPLHIKFGIEARVNDIHENTISALREAGLEELLIGLESGSQRCLDRLKKNTTVEQNERALKILRQAGLTPNIGFIMFQPDSTPEDIRVNFEFLKRNELLEDVKISANLLYHNQILLQGSQCYRELKDLPTPKPYHVTLPYENEQVGQLAAFMRELTNGLFRHMMPLWSTSYQEGEATFAVYRRLNALLVNTFEEVLTHLEQQGCYAQGDLLSLAEEKETAVTALCEEVYATLPEHWQDDQKAYPTC